MNKVNNKFGGTVVGLRVWEIHPSEYSHGLHCHALLSKRVNIHIIKRIAKECGMGHVWVKKCDVGAAFYLSKYLTKESGLTSGMRQWGTIGGFKQVKKNNIQVDSQLTRNIKWIQNKIRIQQMGYAFFIYVSKNTSRYGRIQDWPITKLRCVTPEGIEKKRVKEIEAMEHDAAEPEKIEYVIKPVEYDKWHVRQNCNMDIEVEIKKRRMEVPF